MSGWASVSVPTLIVDVSPGRFGILSGSALLTTQSLPTGLSNGEIDDHLGLDLAEALIWPLGGVSSLHRLLTLKLACSSRAPPPAFKTNFRQDPPRLNLALYFTRKAR